jgi:hypothetical protein
MVLVKCKPIIEAFKNAIAEERRKIASEARIATMLDYIETSSRQRRSPGADMHRGSLHIRTLALP